MQTPVNRSAPELSWDRDYRTATEIAGVSRPVAVGKLRNMFLDLTMSGPEIVVFVDGIDEAAEPKTLCDFLYTLTVLSESKLRLFISSRPSGLLNVALGHVTRIVPRVNVLKHDVEVYIEQRLASDRGLTKFSNKTRSRIHSMLVDRSDGMFCWTQCQLDEASKMRSESTLDTAPSLLPRSLLKTYQRSLSRTADNDKIYLRRMLWLTLSLYPLKLGTIVDAIVLEPGMDPFNFRARLINPNELLDICRTFAVYQEGFKDDHEARQIHLAHHSLGDFFCEGLNQDFEFWLPQKASHCELAHLCITCLLLDDWQDSSSENPETVPTEAASSQPLQYAACSWPVHVLKGEAELELQPLICMLMTTVVNYRFRFWIEQLLGYSSGSPYQTHDPQPLYYAASFGLKHTVSHLIQEGADLNVQAGAFGGAVLYAACFRQHPDVVPILLEHRAVATILDYNDMTAIDLVPYYEHADVALVVLAHCSSRSISLRVRIQLESLVLADADNVGLTQNDDVDRVQASSASGPTGTERGRLFRSGEAPPDRATRESQNKIIRVLHLGTGWWRCSECDQANNPELAPTRCSVCSHVLCPACQGQGR